MRAESVFWPIFAPWRICSMMSSSLPSWARVEDLDLQAALGALLDALRPVREALVIGLLRAEHMIELERVGLLRLRGSRRRRASAKPAHRRSTEPSSRSSWEFLLMFAFVALRRTLPPGVLRRASTTKISDMIIEQA